jgi:hypothetical protein
MDPLLTRLDALEAQLQTLQQYTHTTARRLRWWRGLACGLLALALLTWMGCPLICYTDLDTSWCKAIEETLLGRVEPSSRML